ncbi:MAG: hypothetical protein GWN20_12540 [Phycisphaerae bacterium]|nr:hypothetical protein [Phycisphaerae bacterium]
MTTKTKTTMLRMIEDIENQLATLRQAVEQLSEAPETTEVDILTELEQEVVEKNDDLEVIFSVLREVWDIPPDMKTELSLLEIQKAMSEGLPENWASREAIRMREE